MNNIAYEKIDDLFKIKKEYGENMTHLCRKLFPSILEQKGLLYYLLSNHFAKSKDLFYDIIKEEKEENFKEYIHFFYDELMETNKQENNAEKEPKSVIELLEEKGYDFYKCETNEDILKFKKYYRSNEELCTFRDSNRIENHYIFFIVKKNVDDIKRENFKNLKREDEYSTSVLCIQFDKGSKQRISIISRYNHRVDNPNATYSNNLENIAINLTEAFERDYGFNIGGDYKTNFELDNYVLAKDNKYYKYNYEINNIYYCPNNIIIDNGNITEKYKDKSRYTFMDYFILDESKKEIILYDKNIKDSFIDGLKPITNIDIQNKEGYKEIKLTIVKNKEAIIKLDRNGKIIGYENKYIEKLDDNFLYYNECMKELSLVNLKECYDNFLYSNISLEKLSSPNIIKFGDNCLYHNTSLKIVDLNNLTESGINLLYNNDSIEEFNSPNLRVLKEGTLYFNSSIKKIDLLNLKYYEDRFLPNNNELEEIVLPIQVFFKKTSGFNSHAKKVIVKQYYNRGIKRIKITHYGSLFIGRIKREKVKLLSNEKRYNDDQKARRK